MVPILANEDRRLYEPTYAVGESYIYRRQLNWTNKGVVEKMDDSVKGRWTYNIIPDISKRIKRHDGEVNYGRTQFLSEYGGVSRIFLPLRAWQFSMLPGM